MDYETGTATDPADLISKLATFAAGDGWTVNTPVSGRVFVKDTVVVGMDTDADEVFLRGAIAYDAGAAWDAQTNNAAITVAVNCGAGPFPSYHFFSGEEDGACYLHAAVEISAAIYRHFVFGELIKSGSYTGGVYVDGTRWSATAGTTNNPDSTFHQTICDANNSSSAETGHIWVDYDGKANNWQRVRPSTSADTACYGGTRSSSIDAYLSSVPFMDWNLRNLMKPLRYFANRASGLRSPIGRIPHMRFIHMDNLTPTEQFTLGGDTWIVLPITQRTESFGSGSSSIPSSGMYGYAYRLP
jgi:hypothetical protein